MGKIALLCLCWLCLACSDVVEPPAETPFLQGVAGSTNDGGRFTSVRISQPRWGDPSVDRPDTVILELSSSTDVYVEHNGRYRSGSRHDVSPGDSVWAWGVTTEIRTDPPQYPTPHLRVRPQWDW
jgi:hypothetical protein